MKLGDLLENKGRDVLTIGPDDTIHDAVARLVEHNVGALVVVDGAHKAVGIITERDILRLTAKLPSDLRKIFVRDSMSRNLVTASSTATVDDAQAVMTERRVRHLPVVDHGRLTGIVSLGDLVKVRLDQCQFEVRHLEDFVVGKYPA
ncbi:MAG: CBS domain-containing protein [bacterium]|nr:CBS domain-containing protein [bacterium]